MANAVVLAGWMLGGADGFPVQATVRLAWEPAPEMQPMAPRQLPNVVTIRHELSGDDTAALPHAAAPPVRDLLVTLLSGVTDAEATGLRWRDLELAAPTLRLPDRTVSLPRPARAMSHAIAADPAGADTRLVGCQDAVDIEANVIRAAHDAGLVRSGEVAAAVLHRTPVAKLVRQSARFGDLSRWVGSLPREALDA